MCVLAVFVDDCSYFCNSTQLKEELVAHLSEQFKVEDLGKLTHFLGVKIEQTEEKYSLSHEAYVETLLKRHGLSDCNPSSTPMDSGFVALQGKETSPPCDSAQSEAFANIVGALLWIGRICRPDILAATVILTRYTSAPTVAHFTAAKRICRYLKHSKDYKLSYTVGSKPELLAYGDADFAADTTDRKSITGSLFMMCGGPIHWVSKKQGTTSLSTVEAEFIALCTTSQEVLYIQQLLSELGYAQNTAIACDSTGAVSFATNSLTTSRVKHIDVKFHFVRQFLEDGDFSLRRIASKDNLADIFTKPLGNQLHSSITSQIMDVPARGDVGFH